MPPVPAATIGRSVIVLASLDPILLDVVKLFGCCVAVVLVFQRLKVPPIVGFLLTGAVIGPHALGLISHRELVEQLAEVGVVILLFSVGMELPMGQLARMRRTVLLGGGVQIGATVLLGAGAAMAGGLAWEPAVFLGLLLAMSSTAAVSKLLADRGELGSPVGRFGLGILVAQDLAVVPMILALPLLAGTGDEGMLAALGQTALAFVWLLLTVLATWVVAPRILDLVCRTRSRETFVLAIIGICLAVAVCTAQLGLSLALGAFLAGVVLSESDYHHMAMSEVGPFRDALSSLFFVSIGMLFDPQVLVDQPILLAVALAAVVIGKSAVIWLTAGLLGKATWVGLRSGLLLAQVGEFSFVLVQIADPRLLPERLREIFLAVAVLSITATPFLYALGNRLRRARQSAERRGGADGAGAPADATKRRQQHAILVGFGPAGQATAAALHQLGLPFCVVEMNSDTVKRHRAQGYDIFTGDATRPLVLRAADVSRARVLVLAVNDRQAAEAIAKTAAQLCPSLRIIARAIYMHDVEPLQRAGVHEVVPQELETAVEIMVRVLRQFLVADDVVGRQVAELRQAMPGLPKLAPRPSAAAPAVADFVPGMTIEIGSVQAGSDADGRSLTDLQLRQRTGALVVAVKSGNEVQLAVDPVRPLEAGDVLVLLGPAERMADAHDLLRAPREAPAAAEAADAARGQLS